MTAISVAVVAVGVLYASVPGARDSTPAPADADTDSDSDTDTDFGAESDSESNSVGDFGTDSSSAVSLSFGVPPVAPSLRPTRQSHKPVHLHEHK
ncbi:hypothetical protein [Streptomyces sp. NPDC093109]|uniref:hypothetical protein n=1 Tax=Streptomyces sp. NPDC093109 TaxID=3154977 RepID=UPI00344B8E29